MSNPFQQTMVKLQVPEDMSPSLSIGGFDLQADKDGCVEVPKHLAPTLREHGLRDYVEPAKKK